MAEDRKKPKLGPFLPIIDEILDADHDAPVKQRHTAKRIYERLRDEYGYEGCESQVRAAVGRARRYSKEAFVPLSHPPAMPNSTSARRPSRSPGFAARRPSG